MKKMIKYFMVCLLALSACGRDRIYQGKTVRVPKGVTFFEKTNKTPPMLQEDAKPRQLEWKAPDSWESNPASGIRLAWFRLPGGGECSIVSLSGEGGGSAANLNMWRSQIELEPIDENTALKSYKKSDSGFLWTLIVNDKSNKGILAAIIPFDDSTVFVKCSAMKEELLKEQDNFLLLAESIK